MQKGVSHIRYLRKIGFNANNFFSANLPKSDKGSDLNIMHGLELKSKNGELKHFKQTRAKSLDSN